MTNPQPPEGMLWCSPERPCYVCLLTAFGAEDDYDECVGAYRPYDVIAEAEKARRTHNIREHAAAAETANPVAAELRAQADRIERQADTTPTLSVQGSAMVVTLSGVVRRLRERADELDGAPASAEVDPCAGLKVGDTLPAEYRGVGFCSADHGWFSCIRAPGHPGQHIAATSTEIVAVWPQDGAS